MAWLPKNKVLVPVDFSDPSLAALQVALELAGGAAGVHVIHVLPQLSALEPGVVFGNVTDESRMEKATHAVQAKLEKAGHGDVTVALRVGSPSREVSRYASEHAVDIIVIPAHAGNADGVFQLGSTASRVMNLAPCPVLVLKD